MNYLDSKHSNQKINNFYKQIVPQLVLNQLITKKKIKSSPKTNQNNHKLAKMRIKKLIRKKQKTKQVMQ